jgi:hypothetical protein
MKFEREAFDVATSGGTGLSTLVFWRQFASMVKNEDSASLEMFLHAWYMAPVTAGLAANALAVANRAVAYQRREYAIENESVWSIETASSFYDLFIDITLRNWAEIDPRETLSSITDFSVVLHLLHPTYFFPYYFVNHYFRLEDSAAAFEIALPPVPAVTENLKERLLYYFALCRVFYDFRVAHGLSPEELNTFLYYYAPVKTRAAAVAERGARVFLVESSESDAAVLIARAAVGTRAYWPAPTAVQTGDLLITYTAGKTKQVNGLWRAISRGFAEPFCPWESLTWGYFLGRLPAVGLVELSEAAARAAGSDGSARCAIL